MVADAPCETWPVDLDDCAGLPDDVSQATIDKWSAVATQVLWALSGRRYGPCERTIRPCRRSCLDPYVTERAIPGFDGRWIPYLDGGVWRNASVCGCAGDCSCSELCEVYLPGPVSSVTEVTIDGAIIDPNDYRVDAPGLLVRQSGGCWPSCQDMAAVAGADGTFVVTYEVGLDLTEAALAAVSAFTCELIKAVTPECDCQLPKRVTQIARAGVVAQFIDPQDFLENGRTGIYLTDMWLKSVNPFGLVAPPRVMSPDHRGPRATVWP